MENSIYRTFLLHGVKSFRRDSEMAFEEAIKMTLIGEANRESNFGKSFFLRDHFYGFFDAQLILKFVRRQTDLRSENAVQVVWAEISDFSTLR